MQVEQQPDGGLVRWYDTNRDGHRDYGEEYSPAGQITRLRYLEGGENHTVELASVPAGERRNLLIILDSIPQSVVEDAWKAGGLRFFGEPSRIIAPFPVMTDVSLVDFFHLTPGIAIESDYYDGKRETDAYSIYLNAGVAVWHQKVDYWMTHLVHSSAYLDQLPWYDHELRQIQDDFGRSRKQTFVGYAVGTSALGALRGRSGHEIGLAQIDRLCHELMFEMRGRLTITLLSDHGHCYYESKRIPLADKLRSFGYRISTQLNGPRDLVVPEFAMVSCAAVYTRNPAPVAQDVLRIEGIELSAFPESDGSLIVLGRDGKARIRRSSDGYCYEQLQGDPLQLAAIWDGLKQQGKVRADGSVADADLFAATMDHVYPDGIDRLWRAFHEQFQHTPDVLISVAQGYHCGSAFQSRSVKLVAVHGNLRPESTDGFILTNAGSLPPVLRMRDVAPALAQAGVNVLQ
jgi:hypothetical protein